MEHQSEVAEIVISTVILLLIAAGVLALSKRIKLPFTVLLVIVGLLLTQLAEHYPHSLEILHTITITPDLILYVFLPALIFESSFNLDSRLLRHNLLPILTLAVPGLLLSTALIGLIVWLVTDIPLAAALLLGSILSATDPVAVVSIFKQLGAPQRLTVLVEGESLLNDATSIVVARILIGVVAAGTVSASTITGGIIDFFVLFVGGLLVGIALGLVSAYLLGKVKADPYIEISLTTILAYLSFLLAEETLGVSGVMATVGAGLTLGSWGRIRISPSIRHYLENFWEYMAFIANALIFLLVGMKLDLNALLHSWHILAWVIVAMLIARAVIIYGLMPFIGRFPGNQPVSIPYQTVMYWGGLRGAIALAIVLSLPEFPYSDLFVAVVMGAVLFTLLVQAMTIEPLVKWLGLNKAPLSDRMALLERDLHAADMAYHRIPALQAGGLFSPPIAARLQEKCHKQINQAKHAMDDLRGAELNESQALCLLYLRAFVEEKSVYIQMFNKGHLSEGAYRELVLVLVLQIDAVRNQHDFQGIHSHRVRRIVENVMQQLMRKSRQLTSVAERLRRKRIARNYEEVWGHYQGSMRVLHYLDEVSEQKTMPEHLVENVRSHYEHWCELAKQQLDQVAEQFPEFVNAIQEQLGQRMVLLSYLEATEEAAHHDLIPGGMAEGLLHEIEEELSLIHIQHKDIEKLRVAPEDLLSVVPFFSELSGQEFEHFVKGMIPLSLSEKEIIIAQGDEGDSLFLIARGVVRVSHKDDGHVRELGTLKAGDFFGEMALLHREPRTATVKTVTPCMLYELKRDILEEAMTAHPGILEALKKADVQRKKGLEDTTGD